MKRKMKIVVLMYLLCFSCGLGAAEKGSSSESIHSDIAASAEQIEPFATGEKIPVVNIRDLKGNLFDLNKAIKKQPAVIIFYRGGWCPYCNVQLGQLKTIESQLQELGFQIIAISPDRPEKLVESIDKQQLTYKLLSDSDMTAAKAFGIAFQVADETIKKYEEYGIDLEESSGQNHHLLPVPSVFIVGTDGVIDFSYTNPDYKVRLVPEDLLKAAKASIEHSLYNELLKQYVKDGFVNYAGIKNDTQKLNKYLKDLSQVSKEKFKSWDKNRQLAYLINLYNAATLKLIVDHYPVKSIKDIGGFFKGPWDQKFIQLFGDTVTLGTIEHEVIRKDYDEPRIHVALVCAAKGCPPLREEAYTAARLDAQLDDQSKTFLASPKGLRIDRPNRKAYLSSIFKWFNKDFTEKYNLSIPKGHSLGKFSENERSVLNFIGRYVSVDDRKYLQSGNYSIDYLDYDWSLNERQVNK